MNARQAFEQWWTSGQPDTDAGRLALAGPAGQDAWVAFEAGWLAALRERPGIPLMGGRPGRLRS